MFRLLIKKWKASKLKVKNIWLLAVCIICSGMLFFVVLEGLSYLVFRDKINNYTTEVLRRAESLYEQLETVGHVANLNEGISSAPCSYENLQQLRIFIWPYPLIKDVGYVTQIGLTCTATWGIFQAHIPLNRFEKKIQIKDSTWLFGVSLLDKISADIYIKNGVSIIISPFSFKRFETDMHTKDFSAVIGDRDHNNHYFKIGPYAGLLDKHTGLPFKFTISTQLSNRYDISVTGGAYFQGVTGAHWGVGLVLLLLSIMSGSMAYIIIISKKESRDSLSVMFAKALQQDGLSLVYQPIFKIKDESICGFETLLRWNDDRLGSIGPDVFIPLSETDGLQEEVTLYVLKHAIHDFIHVAIQYNIFLSININVSDLHSERFSSTLINLIQDYQIPNGLILLEISERHGGNLEDMKLFIEKYKLIGVRFAIDDFGTGHSNLNLISALEIDEIKIDKCFTDTIGTTSFRKNILPGLQTMFKHISEKIIFEGVETQIQVEYLKEFWPGSCIQGWYYSKALGFPEAVKLISQNRESHPKRLINRT